MKTKEPEIPVAIGIDDIKAAFAAGHSRVRCCSPRYQNTRKLCTTVQEAEVFLKYMDDGPPNTNEIFSFMHCGLCIKEKPHHVSPREWARLEVGFTPHGLQIWCKRHECNVGHVDFEGQQHPCNQTIHQGPELTGRKKN